MSSLSRTLGRIEERCNATAKGLSSQAEALSRLHTLYNEIRNSVMNASKLQTVVQDHQVWIEAREQSDKIRAARAEAVASVRKDESVEHDRSLLARAKRAAVIGAAGVVGSLFATFIIGLMGYLVTIYIGKAK